LLEPCFSRLRLSLLPSIPSDLDFIVPVRYTVNIDGQRFLLADLSNQKRFKRLLVFASDRQLDILFQCDWLFIDGTFKIVPALFAQLVCIVGIFEGQVVTLCYALVDSKHTDAYRSIIRSLKEEAVKRGGVLNPNYVMTDFEAGLIKAISAEFPTTTHHVGCFFHHTQSIYRMIATLGLKATYENVESVRDLCRKLMAVALLPIDDVEDGYLEVLNQLTLETFSDTHVFNLMNDLMNYYDREWLRVIGMNNRISHKLVEAHPNVWKVLDMLVSEEFHTHQYVNQVITGRKRPSRATKEQKRYQKQLDNLYDLYGRKVIDLPTMLSGLGSMVANNTKSKQKKKD
ncbi:unnamed protein product, partial [Rotaria sordida]